MSERKLNHLSDLSHLLSTSTNVIIANLVEVVLFLVSLDRLALAVNNGILCDDTILGRIDLNNLEFYLSHTTANDKQVSLANRSVSFSEVGSEENVEQGTGDTLDGISDGENSNSLGLQKC
jgi:hypothetical protein